MEVMESTVGQRRWEWRTYLNLKEVLWGAIDLFKGLLARIWHSLHGRNVLSALMRYVAEISYGK